MITVDTAQIRALERDLQRFSAIILPKANSSALTSIAFDAMRTARTDLPQYLTLRAPAKYTQKSIRYNKATGSQIQSQRSAVGSDLAYMRDQEYGAVRRGQRGGGYPIATPTASGESGAESRGGDNTSYPGDYVRASLRQPV